MSTTAPSKTPLEMAIDYLETYEKRVDSADYNKGTIAQTLALLAIADEIRQLRLLLGGELADIRTAIYTQAFSG